MRAKERRRKQKLKEDVKRKRRQRKKQIREKGIVSTKTKIDPQGALMLRSVLKDLAKEHSIKNASIYQNNLLLQKINEARGTPYTEQEIKRLVRKKRVLL